MANTKSISVARASSQYAYVSNAFGIDGGACTYEAWVQFASTPTGTGNDNRRGITTLSSAGTDTQFDLSYSGVDGALRIRGNRQKAGVGQTNVDYVATLSLNTWYHVAMTYDGSTLKLFTASAGGTHTERDSQAASGNGSGFSLPDGFGTGTLANCRNSGDSFATAIGNSIALYDLNNGLIDEVRVWNTARTAAQLDANFEKELIGNETGLVAYYKFADNVSDTTSNAYNLTAVNTPTYSATVPFSTPSGPVNVKTINGLTIAAGDIKTWNGIPIADIKTLDGIN